MYRKGFYKKVDIEPPPIEGLELYIHAFSELSTCRNGFGGLAPLPFTAIAEYYKIYDVGDFDDFLFVIRSMDDKLIEIESSKKKGSENGSNNADKRNPNKDDRGHSRAKKSR